MSTVAETVLARTTVRVWSASRDSRVGIATEFPSVDGAQKRYAIHLLNWPTSKPLVISENDLNTLWLLQPRVDVKWLNVGSMWVRNDEHQNWKRPVVTGLRYEIEAVAGSGHVRARRRVKTDKGWGYTYFSHTCYSFMSQFTRLWGMEVPKGEIPQEPLPFLSRKLPGRPKKEKPQPKSALERLLERDLIPE